MKLKVIWLAFITLIPVLGFSQSTIVGIIINQETRVPVQNAHVKIFGTTEGTVSGENGEFTLSVEKERVDLEISSLGFKPANYAVNTKDGTLNLGVIEIQPQPYSLDEISVNAGLSSDNKLPVMVSSISSKTIESQLGDQPLPLIFQNTPGVFSVRNGGGSGDARLSIRGFHQENISLLLNGIPINGEENGLVYWSNWLGLSNSATEIQIQKGAGIANASIYAIGGAVNIITRNAQEQRSGSFTIGATSYGNFNTNLMLNTGIMQNGWSLSAMVNAEKGTGYIDATHVSAISYFFTANKKIGNKHHINISLIGAPQRHGQRTLKLSSEEVDINGLKFNKDWGGFNGKVRNASQNFYHKPFLSVTDDFRIDNNNKLTTTFYISYGTGGGLWSESFNYAPSIFSYRDYSGQLDWYSIYENNATHEDTYTLENGETVSGFSKNVQTKFLASHIQTGLKINFEHKFNDKLKLLSGIHYRYFNSFLREEISDLLGGKFYIEDYGWSLAGVAGRNQIKSVGDIIKVDNNSIINFASAWGQLVYETSRAVIFLSASANNNWYQRDDRFNYITNTKSETVSRIGFDIRYGAQYNFTENHSLYYNAAYISRVPYFKYVFGNFTNVVVNNLKNEQALSAEIGYKFSNRKVKANFSAFYTKRNNVSMLSNEYVQLENNDQTRAMINGLNSKNMGIEADINVKLSEKIRIGGWMSLGDFKWDNNVTATLFNDNNIAVDTVNVYVKGLYIGGTAQNQAGGYINFNLLRTLNIRAEYQYNNRIYADFDPTQRNIEGDNAQSYKFPSYGVMNLYIGIPFKVGNNYGKVQINGYNILDKKYIVIGEDGADHDLNTFRGFWSFGRNLTMSLTFNF